MIDKKPENKDLLHFDPTKATDPEIRMWLYAIIEAEIRKPEHERDLNLIKECSDCEACLSSGHTEISDWEYEKGLAIVKAHVAAIRSEAPIKQAMAEEREKAMKAIRWKHPKRRRAIRVLAMAATVLITLMLSVTVAASFKGYTVAEWITVNVEKIFDMGAGDKIEGEGITLIKNGYLIEYTSIEQALKREELNVLYPTVLPDGVKIERIVQVYEVENRYTVSLIANSDSLQISIRNYFLNSPELWPDTTVHEIDNIKYYIKLYNDHCEAVGQHNEFEYSIMCSDYDSLIEILNGMKGIEQ